MPNFVKIGQSVAKILRFFDFSRWRPPLSWIVEFAKFYWRTMFGGAIRITVPNIVKIGFLLRRYCNFQIFKMAAAAIWIFEIVKFYWLLGCRGSRRMSVPNFVKIGQSVVKILRLFDFTRWRPPPSWVFKFVKCYWLTVSEGHKHITVPNFITIGRYIAEILRFFKFSRWPPPSWIFEIARFYWLLGSRGARRILHAKFCQNRSLGCEDINIFWFFKMAAVRHIGFVWGIFGPLTVSTCGSLSLCKIWLWSIP